MWLSWVTSGQLSLAKTLDFIKTPRSYGSSRSFLARSLHCFYWTFGGEFWDPGVEGGTRLGRGYPAGASGMFLPHFKRGVVMHDLRRSFFFFFSFVIFYETWWDMFVECIRWFEHPLVGSSFIPRCCFRWKDPGKEEDDWHETYRDFYWRICTPPTMTWHEIGRFMWRVTCLPDLEVMCPSVRQDVLFRNDPNRDARPSFQGHITGIPTFQPHLCPAEHASRQALEWFRMMAPPPCWSLLGAWSPHVTSRSVIAALHPLWLKVHHASTPNTWIEQVQGASVEELHDEVCEDGVPKECNRARTCKVSLCFTTVQVQAGRHSGENCCAPKGHLPGISWKLHLP